MPAQLDDLSSASGAPNHADGRNETHLERCDRNLVELLQEVRVVQTGVRVLFGFMLMAPLTVPFHHLGTRAHVEYYLAFAFTGVAAFALMAPTAYHRVLFRCGDKEYLVNIANRLTILGLGAIGISMVIATVFVTDVLFGPAAGVVAGCAACALVLTLWAGLPLSRRRALGGPAPLHGPVAGAARAEAAHRPRPVLTRR